MVGRLSHHGEGDHPPGRSVSEVPHYEPQSRGKCGAASVSTFSATFCTHYNCRQKPSNSLLNMRSDTWHSLHLC